MRGTDLLIFTIFAFCFNLFTSYICFDFMERIGGPFSSKRWSFAANLFLLNFLLTGVTIIAYPITKILGLLIMIPLFILFLYQKNRKQIMVKMIFLIGAIGGGESFIALLLPVLISPFIKLYATNPWQNGMLVLFVEIIIFALYRIYIYFFKQKKVEVDIKVGVFSFVLIPLFSILNIVLFVELTSYMIHPAIAFSVLADIVFILFLNIYLTYLFDKIVYSEKVKQKLALYEQGADLQYQYYQNMEQKIENSRKVIHDMKNHLTSMEKLYQMEEYEKGNQYGQDIRALLNHFGQTYYTDLRVLNIVLNDKVEKGKRADVDVKCYVGGIHLNFMKEIDITTIFANLLDNAIEAASETKEKAAVILKAETVQEFTVITIENTMGKAPLCVKGHFVSQKKGHYGYGLENVEQTLKNYEGHLRAECYDQIFKISLFIPVTKKGG